MENKSPRNATTVILAIIAGMFVIAAGLILLFKNGIFASLTTTPQITRLNAFQANGANREVFELNANFNLTSAYFWWDCSIQSSDDTLAELTTRCGVPFEQLSAGGSTKGDKTKGARVKVYGTQAGYKITLPAKSKAKMVALVSGTSVPGLVKTITYSTNPNRAVAGTNGSNFSLKSLNLIGYTRYEIEKLDDPDGSLPFRRYYLWYDCQAANLALTTPYSTVSATCGAANKNFGVAGDRLIYSSTYLVPGPKRMVTIVQEKKCPSFSYTGDSTCVYSSNLFVGSLSYTITVRTPTPTPNLSATTTTVVKSSTPTPSQTASVTVPTPTVTSTTTSHVFHKGFNAFGSNIAIDPDRLVDLGLYVYKYGGNWIIYPGSAKFQIDPFKGYYIYARADTAVDLSGGMYLTTSYRVGSGWNMLYTNQPRTLQTLLLNINNTVKPAKDWIAQGAIKPNIFTIADDRASQPCNYFTILANTDSAGDCNNQTVPRATQIPSGRTFWVYVN